MDSTLSASREKRLANIGCMNATRADMSTLAFDGLLQQEHTEGSLVPFSKGHLEKV